MDEAENPTDIEAAAWSALAFDARVFRIVLVKIRGYAICHLGLTVHNPGGVLPRPLSYRGTLGEVLTKALIDVEEIDTVDGNGPRA